MCYYKRSMALNDVDVMCYYKRSMALNGVAVGWSAVCDCGIS